MFQREVVCFRGFLKFCLVVMGFIAFYNFLGGSSTYPYEYGYG